MNSKSKKQREDEFKCVPCGKTFTCKEALQEHENNCEAAQDLLYQIQKNKEQADE